MSDDTPSTEPVVLPPDANPIDTLLTMARFLPDQGKRGIGEIRGPKGDCIGYALLTGHPERDSLPIFDAATRTLEWGLLTDWVTARGSEAASCRWQRRNGVLGPPHITFSLHLGEQRFPGLPPVTPDTTRALPGITWRDCSAASETPPPVFIKSIFGERK